MKSLAKSLKISYLKLIVLFFLVFIFLTIVLGKYMINDIKKELRNGMSFLNHEITEDFSNGLTDFFKNSDIINSYRSENKSIDDFQIYIIYDGLIYNEDIDKRLIDKGVEDEVRNSNFYDYMIFKKTVSLENKDKNYTIYLVKDLKNEKTLFLTIISMFFIGILIAIIISIFNFMKFFKRLKKELKKLENLNTDIDLKNLNLIKPTTNFIEFQNIWNSYMEMLKRLDIQNKKQIDFVNNASHELRTPIFIIGGYIDMIKRWGYKDEKILIESLYSIESEIKNMNQLIDKLFFIAKESEIKTTYTEFEISEIIMECISNLKMKYGDFKIEFNPEYAIINSDESLFKILINNILENAIKYGNNNPISLSITLDKRIEIIVKDNGIGMSEKELKQIFDRFYRADKSRSRKQGGYGLGMSIVKKIVEILEFEIDIRSEVDKGTEVKVKIKKEE